MAAILLYCPVNARLRNKRSINVPSKRKQDKQAEKAGAKRVAAYLRVSSEEQAESGLGLEAQLMKCSAMAQVKEWPEPTIYRDDGISGAKDASARPGLASLLRDARGGRLDAVIIKSLDRLGRRTRLVLELVDDLAAHNVSLVSCQEALDTTTPQGQFVLTIFAAIGQLERDQIAERTRAALSALKVRDGQAGGKLPYGYQRTGKSGTESVTILAPEAATVRRIFEERANGTPLRRIARMLTEAGLSAPRGGPVWRHTAVDSILSNEEAYRGGVRGGTHRWPVLLDTDYPLQGRAAVAAAREERLNPFTSTLIGI